MNPIQAITAALRNAFNANGRASLSEFWWFFLFFCLTFYTALTIVLGKVNVPSWVMVIVGIWFYLSPVLLFLCTMRRLRDAGLNALLALLYIVPVGPIVVLALCMTPTKENDEQNN